MRLVVRGADNQTLRRRNSVSRFVIGVAASRLNLFSTHKPPAIQRISVDQHRSEALRRSPGRTWLHLSAGRV